MAARNVLLGKTLVPMVSDFGLARDIYVSGMYEDVKGVSSSQLYGRVTLSEVLLTIIGHHQGKRPVRWMAPESIEDYTCTSKSDV